MDGEMMTDNEKLIWLLRSVGYVGVDFGHGEFELNHEHIETARELYNTLNKSSRSPGCYIAVPAAELEKLEQAREALYEFLTPYLNERDMLGLVNITSQIWRVANTKKWD